MSKEYIEQERKKKRKQKENW